MDAPYVMPKAKRDEFTSQLRALVVDKECRREMHDRIIANGFECYQCAQYHSPCVDRDVAKEEALKALISSAAFKAGVEADADESK